MQGNTEFTGGKKRGVLKIYLVGGWQMLLPRNLGFWRSILTSSGRMVGGVCCISVLLSKFPHWLVHSVCNRQSHVNLRRENWNLKMYHQYLAINWIDLIELVSRAQQMRELKQKKKQKLKPVTTIRKYTTWSNHAHLNEAFFTRLAALHEGQTLIYAK